MKEENRLWDFEIIKELGRGEYGQVFEVKSKKNNKIYALKKINLANAHVIHQSYFSKKKRYRPIEKSKHLNSSITQIS